MTQVLADLLQLLDLERIEINLFRGESRPTGRPGGCGGRVPGRPRRGAGRTVGGGGGVHSLHS